MPTNAAVQSVLVPAAGLGTRMLPATKTIPKELLPLVDRPVIQYGVEEAVQAGIRRIVIVTSPGNTLTVSHFAPAPELEAELTARGKPDLLATVRDLSAMADIACVEQPAPLGLGHAVLCGRSAVGDAPFAVMLPDDVIDADPPALRQMLDVFAECGGPVLLVERVPRAAVHRYGIIAAEPIREGVFRVTDLVEKPSVADAPSDLAIIGRYVLTPDVFPRARIDGHRRRGRDPVDRRPAPPAAEPTALRLRAARNPARRRQPERLHQGHHPLRREAAVPGRGTAGSARTPGVPTRRRLSGAATP